MNFNWPLVNLSKVGQDWKSEVEAGVKDFQDLFELKLPGNAIFTAKAIVHVVLNKNRREVSSFFEGSTHLHDLLKVHDRLTHNPQEAHVLLADLVQEYFSDFIIAYSEQLQ